MFSFYQFPAIDDRKNGKPRAGLLCKGIHRSDYTFWYSETSNGSLDDTRIRIFNISWTQKEIQVSTEGLKLVTKFFHCPVEVKYIGVASGGKYDVKWTRPTCGLGE